MTVEENNVPISLGGVNIPVKPMYIPIDKLELHPSNPRVSLVKDKKDKQELLDSLELRRSIKENRGIAQKLIVENLKGDDTYQPLEGNRRLYNINKLLKEDPSSKEYLNMIPCDVIQMKLTDEQRMRIWVYIHRNREEWGAKVKESTTVALVDKFGYVTAAEIIGESVKAVEKYVDIYKFSERMGGKGQDKISYAREFKQLAQKYRTKDVEDAVVDKVNRGVISTPLKIRELRKVLPDPELKKEFLEPDTTVDELLNKATPAPVVSMASTADPAQRLHQAISALKLSLKSISMFDSLSAKGDTALVSEIDECINLLQKEKQVLA